MQVFQPAGSGKSRLEKAEKRRCREEAGLGHALTLRLLDSWHSRLVPEVLFHVKSLSGGVGS